MLILCIADAEKDVSMKNLSPKEAIALLRNLEDSLDSYCELNEEGKTAFRMAIEALSCSEIPNNSDTISRQAAIDAIYEDANWLAAQGSDWQVERMERDKSILKSLPSAEPDIIRCEDCKHYIRHDKRCGYWNHGVKPTMWCSQAERREDE